ncbi:MAG: hypothetical protein WCV99_14320 [Sterolibacterium sp.]|jgi:hypothetical protein
MPGFLLGSVRRTPSSTGIPATDIAGQRRVGRSVSYHLALNSPGLVSAISDRPFLKGDCPISASDTRKSGSIDYPSNCTLAPSSRRQESAWPGVSGSAGDPPSPTGSDAHMKHNAV